MTDQEIRQRALDLETDRDKGTRAVFYAYKRMYEMAGADFRKLVMESPIVSGRIEIPYNEYFITTEDFEAVLKETKLTFKLTKYEYKSLVTTTTLGCSPRFKV